MTADIRTETHEESTPRTPGILRVLDPTVHPVYLAEAYKDRTAQAELPAPLPQVAAILRRRGLGRLFHL